jgi:parallel beta-helix repeat protein
MIIYVVFKVNGKGATLFLLLVFCSFLVAISNIETVRASEAIYIRADGSVEGTDKIQRNGNIYTFTDNINGNIVVERDNLVVDGAGYTLQGDGNGRGIDLYDDSTSITVKNMQIRDFNFGIHLSNASYSIIESNYIANNLEGIRINGGFNNTLIGNTITNNSDNGISVFFNTHHNLISGNKITNNWVGVLFQLYSSSNTLSENFITANNGMGIWLDGGSNNRIIRNNITDNAKGVFISATKNSTVYHNNFVNNTFHVYIHGNDPVISMWDNGVQGNYWDTYTGVDNDGDGIGETPYVIDENNQDNYPLINEFIIPEFPSWTPLLIMLLSVTMIAIIYRCSIHKHKYGTE